ncbi:MAG: hypothetical protein U0559_04975 [Anaerolineae bacterium]
MDGMWRWGAGSSLLMPGYVFRREDQSGGWRAADVFDLGLYLVKANAKVYLPLVRKWRAEGFPEVLFARQHLIVMASADQADL